MSLTGFRKLFFCGTSFAAVIRMLQVDVAGHARGRIKGIVGTNVEVAMADGGEDRRTESVLSVTMVEGRKTSARHKIGLRSSQQLTDQ